MTGSKRGKRRAAGETRQGRSRLAPGLVVLGVIAAVGGLWRWYPKAGPTELPDILLISVDTLRADRLGCYGYKGARTPNIDRLAAAGAVFDTVISPVPITLPSHTSMLTGLIPPRHGVRLNEDHRLPDSAVTLAEVLHDRGYATGAFIGGLPMKRAGGLAQGFDVYDDTLAPQTFRGSKTSNRQERYAEDVFAVARAWLKSADATRPAFAFIHIYDPHAPYLKPMPGAAAPSYDGEIAHVDRELGRFVSSLASLARPRQRLTILTSDHGEGLGEHGEKTHCVFVYETTLHVPLIIHWPEVIEAGRVGTEAGVIDVAPTILALVGLPRLQNVDGQSLVRAMGRDKTDQRVFYFESLLGLLRFGWAPLRGVRDGSIKYIEAPRPELYDLSADPHELTNRYDASHDQALRLADHLLSIGEGTRATATSDRETIRALESLGYVSAPPVASEEPSERRDPKDCIIDYDRYQAAHMECALDHPDKALTIMQELEPAFQSSAVFFSRWGSFATQAGRWEQAVSCYEKCLALDADRQEARLNLGVAYLKSNAPAKGLEQFEVLVRINPNHAEAHLYAGAVNNEHLGEPAKAVEHWKRFLEIAPNHKQAESVRRLLDGMGGR